MLPWLYANIGNIVVITLLSAAVLLALRTLISDRKRGKTGCGGSCGACAMHCACAHQKGDEQAEKQNISSRYKK